MRLSGMCERDAALLLRVTLGRGDIQERQEDLDHQYVISLHVAHMLGYVL